MKRLLLLLGILLVAGVLAMGSGYAATESGGKAMGGQQMTECQQSFKSMDTGNKGYLDRRDFEEMHHPPGKHKGFPAGTTMDATHFDQKDVNKDGRVTMEEYCS